VTLAKRGRKVLLISTDPASNLDETFGTEIGSQPTPIPGVDGLSALNLDPVTAAAEYRERVVGPYRNLLPPAAVAAIEEQLSGACTVEIAAFDEFAKLIGNPERTKGFDHIVFDTAPTGHTLRLLSLPGAWTGFFDNAKADASCIGPLQGLAGQRALYSSAVEALADRARTTLVLVSRPERAALEEASRSSQELADIGIRNQEFVLNGVFKANDPSDPVALAMEEAGGTAVEQMPSALVGLTRTIVPLKPRQPLGAEALASFFDSAEPSTVAEPVAEEPSGPTSTPKLPGLEALVEEIAQRGHGIVMTMGKGGVGKSTIAAEVAEALAMRGHDVLLTTTDPAGSFDNVNGGAHLSVGRIDPEAEVARYRAEVMATTGTKLDEAGRALLEEDLSSPCTEEIAVFQAFAATVDRGQNGFVVLDTAPTGHTILLLDAAQSFHREVSRQAKAVPEPVLRLLDRLRDPEFAHIILCTLPEATPVHEAAALQQDLGRAGITPFGWVINQSLSPLKVSDPVLVQRQAQESRYIREVVEQQAPRAALVGWHTSSPQ